MGFLATFRAYIEYANILLKLTMKNQAFQAMEELRNENPITKLMASTLHKQLVSCSFL
jgi:hypothetical protein